MASTFETWLLCNVLSSVGIFIVIIIILSIFQWRFPKVFYAAVAKLFRIKRCVIDVNHKIVKNNSDLSMSHGKKKNIRRYISNIITCGARVEDMPSNAQPTVLERTKMSTKWPSPNDVVSITSAEETNYKPNLKYQSERNPVHIRVRSNVKEKHFRQIVRSVTVKANQPMSASSRNGASSAKPYIALNVPEDHPAHPAYQRDILNVYGKYLPLRKKRNRFLILLLSSIVIATVVIAFCEGCVLASVTLYQGSPCPTYGNMECFHGSNQTYFQCATGGEIDFPLLGTSATCFRWIVRDQSASSVLAQIGICTGIITAFGSLTEVFLRLLFYAYQQRRGVANGMRRVLERTVGVNNVTQPLCSCCIKFPIRVPPPNIRLYRYPTVVCMTIAGYIIVTVLAPLAYIPLIYFQASVTSFTYIILCVIALLCFFTMVWVVWEVDEICRILPGGCMNIIDILKSKAFKNAIVLLDVLKDPDIAKEELGESESGSSETEESEPKRNSAKTKSPTASNEEGAGNWAGKIVRLFNLTGDDPKKKLSTEVIKQLREITTFSEEDIEEWHAGFLRDCPKGQLSRKKFISIFEKFFVKGHRARSFAKYFFGIFNADKKKRTINFVEFLVTIAPNTQGHWQDRLDLAFEMYDISESNSIDKKGLTMWIKAMYDVAGMPSRVRGGNYDPKKSAEDILKQFDTNDDKKLSKDEFTEGCRQHQNLLAVLIPPTPNRSDE